MSEPSIGAQAKSSSGLQENVFSIAYPPTKEQANSKGYVLYWNKAYGWHKGVFSLPRQPDVTHWTYLPDDLPAEEDPLALRDARFAEWLGSFPIGFDPPIEALLKMGFVGGYQYRGQP